MLKEISNVFAKTKILATLGPASSTTENIQQLIDAGLDGVRLNFSHGKYDFYESLYDSIDTACKAKQAPLAVLIDLQGPKIRVGDLAKPEIELVDGEKIEITSKDLPGTKDVISTSYKLLVNDAKVGNTILIDDGLIKLIVTGKSDDSVFCEIESGGILKPRKGMNLPGMRLSTPSVTEKDISDLTFALKHRVDYIALSFVRKAIDIVELKNWLKKHGSYTPVIAKIEKEEAVNDFDEILKVADGIMVARGDLGVEMSACRVPIIQKQIIKRCNSVGKLVITATQMLESMISNPVPTRAEASDVANAVWDGTDVVMLSAETSVGKNPVRAVQIMNNIVRYAEENLDKVSAIPYEIPSSLEENLFDSYCYAVSDLSKRVKASAIVVFTHKGRTAVRLSKYRPDARIVAISNCFETMNNLCLKYGVTSIFAEDIKDEQKAIENARQLVIQSGHVKKGDVVVITSGAPFSDKSRMNWLKFAVI